MRKSQVDIPVAEGSEAVLTKPKKGKKIASIVINVVLIIAIVLAAMCTYVSYVSTSGSGVPSIFGARIFSIQTKSMYPTLNSGDLIFDVRVKDASELQVDDIITYWTVIDGERVLNTHRINEIYDGGGYRIFQTKGDANTLEDSLTVHESEIVGRYTGRKINGLGKVFDYLQTSTGFMIVVVVPVAIFFLFHLIQFFRVLFEYQNVKNKLLYEQERGKTEDLVADEKRANEEAKQKERERLEAELREQLKEEILKSGALDLSGETKTISEKDSKADDAEAKVKAEAEERAKLEVELREKIMAEEAAKAEAAAKAKAEEEAKAEERARLEAELREKIKAEMAAEAASAAKTEAVSDDSESAAENGEFQSVETDKE
ncbi:MAG: signal peptidase I [Clostridiales bacterium]|nr:signal peptidase I [Clostridiales bacterium]